MTIDLEQHVLDILSVDVDNLRRKQYEAVRDFTIARLRDVATALKSDDLEAISHFLACSPSGDDMGTEVDYINFSPLPYGEGDIGSVLRALKMMKEELND